MSRFILNHHLYLTNELDIVTFHDDLVKDLKGSKLVVTNDWNVQFLCLYTFQTTDNDLMISFNTFIHRKKSDGTLERLYKKWYQVTTFSDGPQKYSNDILDNVRLQNLCFIAIFGSVLAMILSLYSTYKRSATTVLPMQLGTF